MLQVDLTTSVFPPSLKVLALLCRDQNRPGAKRNTKIIIKRLESLLETVIVVKIIPILKPKLRDNRCRSSTNLRHRSYSILIRSIRSKSEIVGVVIKTRYEVIVMVEGDLGTSVLLDPYGS